METITIKLKNEKARRLIQDLEELEIIEVLDNELTKKVVSKVSDLKGDISVPMTNIEINDQLEKIRNEWQPNT